MAAAAAITPNAERRPWAAGIGIACTAGSAVNDLIRVCPVAVGSRLMFIDEK